MVCVNCCVVWVSAGCEGADAGHWQVAGADGTFVVLVVLVKSCLDDLLDESGAEKEGTILVIGAIVEQVEVVMWVMFKGD